MKQDSPQVARRFLQSFLYYVVDRIWFLFSLLPFWMLYCLSDILYFPLYYFIRYRRKIVRKNLTNAFPEKILKEIVRTEKKFYAFFCDCFVETLKLFSMDEKTIRKRMTFEGIEEVEKAMGNDKSCILYVAHYCNWEWVSSLPMYFNPRFFRGQIYHPLENKLFDRLFFKIRGRFQGESIPREKTLRKIVGLKQENKQFIIGFISDQIPNGSSMRHWTDFLHQDTSVFVGAERIARQTGSVSFYADIRRIKRGYYNCRFIPLACREQSEYALTDLYFQYLEKTIQRDPPYWLWSHNRWKRPRTKINP
jgi:KDO2-lipid IV(A) lauroyltransferase